MRSPDAIFVLGCRVSPAGRPGPALQRRCEAAAEAARAWPDAQVIACGGRHWGGVVEADAMARAIAELGVAPERILRERLSLTTRENLRCGAAVLARVRRAGEAPRVAIVSCDWHVPRAIAIARVLGLDALARPATGPRPPRGRRWVRAMRERIQQALDVRATRRGR